MRLGGNYVPPSATLGHSAAAISSASTASPMTRIRCQQKGGWIDWTLRRSTGPRPTRACLTSTPPLFSVHVARPDNLLHGGLACFEHCLGVPGRGNDRFFVSYGRGSKCNGLGQ